MNSELTNLEKTYSEQNELLSDKINELNNQIKRQKEAIRMQEEVSEEKYKDLIEN